nr:hypothetical protein [Corynebacterium lactis]
MKIRSLSTIVSACALAALSFPAAVAPASAAPVSGGDVVMLGDSIFANPTDRVVAQHLILRDEKVSSIPGAKTLIAGDENWQKTDCLVGDKTVAAELAQISGRTVHNYSCAGATGVIAQDGVRNFDQQINLAQEQGNLNASTSTVLIQFGFNDYRDESMKTHDATAPTSTP